MEISNEGVTEASNQEDAKLSGEETAEAREEERTVAPEAAVGEQQSEQDGTKTMEETNVKEDDLSKSIALSDTGIDSKNPNQR